MNAPEPTTRDVLTQTEAEARAARVSDVAYAIALDLTRGAGTYRGDVAITFRTTGSGPLFLDFTGKRIESLEVNGVAVERPQWTGYRLTLDGASLAADVTKTIDGDELVMLRDPWGLPLQLVRRVEPMI